MPEKKFSKERLEKSKFWFLEPKIESGIDYALKRSKFMRYPMMLSSTEQSKISLNPPTESLQPAPGWPALPIPQIPFGTTDQVPKERYKSHRASPIVIKFPVDIDNEEYIGYMLPE